MKSRRSWARRAIFSSSAICCLLFRLLTGSAVRFRFRIRWQNWFAKRPRWHMHFTPTSSSWINQVERFFALLAEKKIKHGTHTSVKQLIAAIEGFIDQQNANPKPLRWTKSTDDILASIQSFCRRTLDVHAKAG